MVQDRKRALRAENISGVMMTLFLSKANWRLAFVTAKTQFELREIQPEQRKAIKSFFEGNNVLVNLPTGFGKC